MKFKEAIISLPYSKPGEDLNKCIIEDKFGCTNVKLTIRKMLDLLEASTHQLENIYEQLPDNNALDIYGSGRVIGICGDNEIIDELISKGLVFEDDFIQEDEDSD
jgi:hypothetical protein